MFLQSLKSLLKQPHLSDIDIDSHEMVTFQQKCLKNKPLLRLAYEQWYEKIVEASKTIENLEGLRIELGCGPSFLDTYLPDIIKTDIIPHPNADQQVNAEKLPYPNNSIALIAMTQTLHHLKSPQKFLFESQRCLKPRGRLVLIEPANTPLWKFLINRFAPHEYFDDQTEKWENDHRTGRMTGANNALAWNIFKRDQLKFEKRFSSFKIVSIKKHTGIALYTSGAFSYRSLVPAFTSHAIRQIEPIFEPLNTLMAAYMTVVIEKKSNHFRKKNSFNC